MSDDHERATAFVDGYGGTWENWDIAGFVELFSDGIVYVAHPTEETVVGKEALASYLRKEQTEQGAVSVRMGKPIVEAAHVVAEFWVTATNRGGEATIAGCLVAQLDPRDGRCTHFREYWFDIDGHTNAFPGWGE
jgi:ketosteroid isomerase-like protein